MQYVKFIHNEITLNPVDVTISKDKGCMITGSVFYDKNPYPGSILGAFFLKVDSSGNFADINGAEVEIQDALVYPNPANDIINVVNGIYKQKVKIELYNINGKKVMEESLQPMDNSFNISDLSTGIYIYNIKSTNKVYQTGKIIKQ